jgi:hypothetical protein
VALERREDADDRVCSLLIVPEVSKWLVGVFQTPVANPNYRTAFNTAMP